MLHFNANLHSLSFWPFHVTATLMSQHHHKHKQHLPHYPHQQHAGWAQWQCHLLPKQEASDSSKEEEEPILQDPPPWSSSNMEAAAMASTAPHSPPLKVPTKKPLVQSGLFGFKFVDTTKQIPVRQFKKKSGSKVRSHSRSKHLARSSGVRPAGLPLAPSDNW